MTDVFQRGVADLSGMDGTRDLYVTEVYHQSYIQVDEEGKEAAAASAVEVWLECMTMPFNADHPFIFLIKENRDNAVLFLGRYVKP